MKYFFKRLTEAQEYINGSVKFDQGYINKHIKSEAYNISVYHLPINEAMSGYVMMYKYGLYYKDDINKSILLIYE